MRIGYNTNGFAHHRLEDAIEILAEIGYGAIAITPDVHHLPFDEHQYDEIDLTRCRLKHHGMACVIETGARFLLDPRRKHQPTLVSPTADEREFRRDVLEDHIDIAHQLGATTVSLWSGTSLTGEPFTLLLNRLSEELKRLADHAAAKSVRLAFEPEPGMVIDTMAKFADLVDCVRHPNFGLTLDLGHCLCMNEPPIASIIHTWKSILWNVHIDDMRPGVHDHLPLGDGELDLAAAMDALAGINFDGVAAVELSRHSHDAVRIAAQSWQALRRWA
jgi:L-ribulose-5-phosphate 3-epimerase